MSIMIVVEASLGDEAHETFREAAELARKLGVKAVKFDFNGATCYAYPDDTGLEVPRGRSKRAINWFVRGGKWTWEEA